MATTTTRAPAAALVGPRPPTPAALPPDLKGAMLSQLTQQRIEEETIMALFAALGASSERRPEVWREVRPFGGDIFRAPKTRPLARAIWRLLEQDEGAELTAGALLTVDPALDEAYIDGLDLRADERHITALPNLIARVQDLAVARQLIGYSCGLLEDILAAPDQARQLTRTWIETVEGKALRTGRSGIRDGSVQAIGAERAERATAGVVEQRLLTGLDAFDHTDAFGGLIRDYGERLLIQGESKGRKTSLALYIILSIARRGNLVAIYCTDDDRNALYSWLVALLATAWLRARLCATCDDEVPMVAKGRRDEDYRCPACGGHEWRHRAESHLWNIRPRLVSGGWKTEIQRAAIQEGEAALLRLPIVLRDVGDGISEIDRLMEVVNYDVEQGAVLGVFDYLQDFTVPGPTGYDRLRVMDYLIRNLKTQAVRDKMIHIWLSQRTEDYNKSGGAAGAGAKYGAVAVEGANFIIDTFYDRIATPHLLRARVTRARGMPPTLFEFDLEPNSALILNPMERRILKLESLAA